jgi:hypothetical protein
LQNAAFLLVPAVIIQQGGIGQGGIREGESGTCRYIVVLEEAVTLEKSFSRTGFFFEDFLYEQ